MRVAHTTRARAIVLENVLNLRTMRVPSTGRPFADQIASEVEAAGYEVKYGVFRVSQFGAPQTRRRFIFIGMRGGFPAGFHFPAPSEETTIRPFLYDLAQHGESYNLPNHSPKWGFKSRVHEATAEPFDESEEVVPVRFSRTASDGNPVRSFDAPFPAIDTATIWGFAQGNVHAERRPKDRTNGQYVRNPKSDVTLWRISASRLRAFTEREYARLQTFPDDWEFIGDNKRSLHMQVGNAVPVAFAERFAWTVREALTASAENRVFTDEAGGHLTLF